MNIDLSEAPITSVADLKEVSVAFNVDRICDVMPVGNGSGGFTLLERTIDIPYVKDYDRIDGEGPTQWASRFDITNWGFIRAQSQGRLVGGAVIAFNTPGVIMLERRKDLAVLWDIRVSPEVRERCVGSALLRAAEAWAISTGCTRFKVETQNINVAACRFYEQHGFVLRTVDRFAYPGLPGEIQLLWYKDLSPQPTSSKAG